MPRATAQLFRDAGLARPRRRCRSSRRPPAHLQPVRHPGAATATALQAASRRARHRHRDLLPGAVPPAALLRRPRLPRAASFPHAERAARETPRAPDLRRADRSTQQQARRRRRSREFVAGATSASASAIAATDRRRRAMPRRAACPALTTQIFIGLAARHRRRLALARRSASRSSRWPTRSCA